MALLLLVLPLRIVAEHREQRRHLSSPADVAWIQNVLPEAAAIRSLDGDAVWRIVDNQEGEAIAWVATTLPHAEDIVGYRGPSNLAIIANPDGRVRDVLLLWSRDTPEHVNAVSEETAFWKALADQEIGNPVAGIDAVSGATLTSLAMIESVGLILTGQKPSLKFPDAITLKEARQVFAETHRMTADSQLPGVWRCFGRDGSALGFIAQSGAMIDDQMGYQGPSDLLIAYRSQDQIDKVSLRSTYDNEPYVDYVRTEGYFWDWFRGKSIVELAGMSSVDPPVEGVSGATMTSQSISLTIVRWAKKMHDRELSLAGQEVRTGSGPVLGVRWTYYDVVTIVLVLLGLGIGNSRLRGRKWLRRLWSALVIGVLGVWMGNLVSQTLLLGWAETGPAWRLAPGLTLLLGVAVLSPPLSKRNVYCHQLCPHGAAQWLVRRPVQGRWQPSGRLRRWLAVLPGCTLLLAYGIALLDLPISLALLEPFEAYAWPMAATVSILLALGSLLVATKIPMAYCRFGCPTGSLLEYVRRHAKSDRWHRGDSMLLATTLAAWGYVVWST